MLKLTCSITNPSKKVTNLIIWKDIVRMFSLGLFLFPFLLSCPSRRINIYAYNLRYFFSTDISCPLSKIRWYKKGHKKKSTPSWWQKMFTWLYLSFIQAYIHFYELFREGFLECFFFNLNAVVYKRINIFIIKQLIWRNRYCAILQSWLLSKFGHCN